MPESRNTAELVTRRTTGLLLRIMGPSADDLDSDGVQGPFNVDGALVFLARWRSDSYMGAPLPPGRLYSVIAENEVLGIVLLDEGGSFRAFLVTELSLGTGAEVNSIWDGAKLFVARLRPDSSSH